MGKRAARRCELRYRNEDLRQIAVDIVAKSQPCRPHYLQRRMNNEYGTSHGEANQTLFTLMPDGELKRTFFGELVLPGYKGRVRPPTMHLVIYILLMLGLIGFIVWIVSQ